MLSKSVCFYQEPALRARSGFGEAAEYGPQLDGRGDESSGRGRRAGHGAAQRAAQRDAHRGHGERSRSELLFKLAGAEKWLLTCWLLKFGCSRTLLL